MILRDNKKWLQAQLKKYGDAAKLARACGTYYQKVTRLLDKHNIKRAHSTWKGGRTKNASGYVMIFVGKEVPGTTRGGYAYEHRVVMEKKLGRKLKSNEIVHHQNGKKDDNRPRNLEVMLKGQHSTHHGTGRKCSRSTRRKIGLANSRPHPWARVSRIKGIKRSEEFKCKVSRGMRRYLKSNPEALAKLGQGKKR